MIGGEWMLILNFYNTKKEKIGSTLINKEEIRSMRINKKAITIEFYDAESLDFEINSMEEMIDKAKKYMLSKTGIFELEVVIKRGLGEELDKIFLKSGQQPND